MGGNVCFVDTETSGLHPEHHGIYEVALIAPEGDEHHWWLDIDLARADEIALKIGRYHERHPNGYGVSPVDGRTSAYTAPGFVGQFARLTHGHHLAGAVVSFDADRLARLFYKFGHAPSWHYHLIDVEALAAGWVSAQCVGKANDGVSRGTVPVWGPTGLSSNIDGRPPWNSEYLSRAVGVDPDQFDRHTALGDARWAKAIYEKVMS